MATATEISSSTDSIARDILFKTSSILDDSNKDAPHTITDQTPTRFLARCSKLDLEPNPFEQSFSHITPLADTPGTNSPKPSLPPVAEITSPAPGGTGISEKYGWNLQSLRTGPLSPAMLGGPQSFDSLGVAAQNGRTGTTPLGFQTFADQSPRSAALFNAQPMAITSTFNNSSNTLKPGSGLMPGQFGSKAVSASVVNTQNGSEMNNESAADVVPTKTEREDYNTLANSTTTTLSTRSRSTKSKTNGVRPPSPTDHNSTSSDEDSDEAMSNAGNDPYGSPKSSKTNHRRKASDDLSEQPAQKKSNQKTKSDLSDAEKRKNFLERNRQAALKCRQRKKQWLANLQAKVEYLTNENEQLQSQATSLREEILNLKTLLLAHKDCPIAQANGVLGIEALAHSQAGITALHGVPIGMNMGMMQNTMQNVHGPNLAAGVGVPTVQQPMNHIQVQPHISNHVNGGPGFMRM